MFSFFSDGEWVNRFVNELTTRDRVTEEIFSKGFPIREFVLSGAEIIRMFIALRGRGGKKPKNERKRIVGLYVGAFFCFCVCVYVSTAESAKDGVAPMDVEKWEEDLAPNMAAFLVLSEKMIDQFGTGSAKFYESKGLLFRFDDADALEKALNIPVGALKESLEAYGDLSRRNATDKFGKNYFPLGELTRHIMYMKNRRRRPR